MLTRCQDVQSQHVSLGQLNDDDTADPHRMRTSSSHVEPDAASWPNRTSNSRALTCVARARVGPASAAAALRSSSPPLYGFRTSMTAGSSLRLRSSQRPGMLGWAVGCQPRSWVIRGRGVVMTTPRRAVARSWTACLP